MSRVLLLVADSHHQLTAKIGRQKQEIIIFTTNKPADTFRGFVAQQQSSQNCHEA